MLFWMMPDSGPNTRQDFENFLAAYRKDRPKEEIRVEYFTRDNLWRKLFLMRFEDDISGMPDLIQVPHTWTPFLTATNSIENLSAVDPSLNLNSFLSPLAPHCYRGGTKDIYGLPWWMDVMALHYREDHLKKVSQNPEEDLKTWQGFLEICAKLKKEFKTSPGYFPVQNSDWRGSISIRYIFPCIWSRGSGLFDEAGKKSCFNDEAFIAGLEDYIALAQREFLPILRERGSLGTMLSGRASIFMTRRQGLSIFDARKSAFEAKTLAVPASGAKSVSFLSGVNLVINKRSEKKEQAFELIKWLLKKENQLKYAALMEVFPAEESSFEEFIFSSPARMKTYAKIVAGARTLPINMVASTATKMLNEVLDRVSLEIIKGTYKREILLAELDRASKEADYLLNLYGDY